MDTYTQTDRPTGQADTDRLTDRYRQTDIDRLIDRPSNWLRQTVRHSDSQRPRIDRPRETYKTPIEAPKVITGQTNWTDRASERRFFFFISRWRCQLRSANERRTPVRATTSETTRPTEAEATISSTKQASAVSLSVCLSLLLGCLSLDRGSVGPEIVYVEWSLQDSPNVKQNMLTCSRKRFVTSSDLTTL